MKKPSRSLNQDSIIVGLNAVDFSLLGISLFVGLKIRDLLGVGESLGVLLAPILLASVLVPLRLRYRRKIIRDSIWYYVTPGARSVFKDHSKPGD